MPEAGNTRDRQLDVAKGLAIFAVVAGHIVLGGITPKIIFLFHVPFFFVLSGYLHRSCGDLGYYLKKKAASLLVPYFMYLALFKGPSVAVQFLHAFSAHDKHAVFAAMRFAGTLIYGGDYLNGTVGIFWFVTCLFLTQQIFNVCVSRLPGKWPVLSAFLLYVLTVAAKPLLGHTVFPWGINIVGCSLLFYAIGYYFGKVIFKEMNGWLIAGTLLLASGSIALVLSGFEIGFYMKHGEYGWFIFSPLAALALIKILGSIAEFAGRIPLAGSFLAFAGTGSLTIMFIHQYLHLTFFMKQCNEWPWVITGLIFVICCLVHFLLSRNALTRALFLGSWGDFALIRKKPAL